MLALDNDDISKMVRSLSGLNSTGSGGGTRTHNLAVNSLTGLLPDGPLTSPYGPS